MYMTLYDQISEDIKAAMKARDKVRLETLRNIKKVFIEAKTAPGANDTLADADAIKIIQKLAKQGRESAAIFTQKGRQDLADGELAQVAVIEGYLPPQLSEAEIEIAVRPASNWRARPTVALSPPSSSVYSRNSDEELSEYIQRAQCWKSRHMQPVILHNHLCASVALLARHGTEVHRFIVQAHEE